MRCEAVPDVVVAAGLELLGLAPRLLVGASGSRAPTRPASRRGPGRSGASASHSGVNRVSSIGTSRSRPARRRAGPRSSCSGYDEPPTPPGDVQSSARRSTRSGQVTASSWATIPPKLMPTTRKRVPADVVEQRGGVGGVVGHRVRPRRDRGAAEPALVVGDDVEARANDVAPSAGPRSRVEPDPLKKSSGPLPRSLVVEVDPVQVAVGIGRARLPGCQRRARAVELASHAVLVGGCAGAERRQVDDGDRRGLGTAHRSDASARTPGPTGCRTPGTRCPPGRGTPPVGRRSTW